MPSSPSESMDVIAPVRSGSGIVIVATAESYRDEARVLLDSLSRHSPELPVTVFVERIPMPAFRHGVNVVVMSEARQSLFDKVLALQQRPYQRTLYLDADTYAAAPIEGVFELLEGCDVAASHDSWRASHPGSPPQVFPELNLGVMLLGNSPAVDQLLSDWLALYEGFSQSWNEPDALVDQHPFWDVLWSAQCEKTLRFLALPQEWNIQSWHPISLAEDSTPRIIHGRGRDLEKVASLLSASSRARVWIPTSRGWGRPTRRAGIIFGDKAGRWLLPGLVFLSTMHYLITHSRPSRRLR